ncbi:unnamed protein product [Darwinula stevensoni]|uniref:ATP synthase mitochondrial F1 complex assembly factor 2 n=1 Tax=Darwinula stevensoni TaxID=69355 RepID=A0A7R9A2H8_9CRUS|nr:unnamed protein product [Darwinula stevensoni]CAG0879530.1 unnamed protein product [Darwinula stevensoni]
MVLRTNANKLLLPGLRLVNLTPARSLKGRKRFYANVSVTSSSDGVSSYEVNLDQRKLKTPMGKVFKAPNRPLALAVAEEWNAQRPSINVNLMHLTGLCNTCLDNPSKLTKEDLIGSILSYLETDTILFHSEEPEELLELQKKEWDPIIQWFQEKFCSSIESSSMISCPLIPIKDLETLRAYLMAYNDWALQGFLFGVEALKSFILMTATVERLVSAEKAVNLARLEAEFQISRWGKVEWAHDLELHALRSRLAAAVLFVHFNSLVETVKHKQHVR